jgi:hypothetical protein
VSRRFNTSPSQKKQALDKALFCFCKIYVCASSLSLQCQLIIIHQEDSSHCHSPSTSSDGTSQQPKRCETLLSSCRRQIYLSPDSIYRAVLLHLLTQYRMSGGYTLSTLRDIVEELRLEMEGGAQKPDVMIEKLSISFLHKLIEHKLISLSTYCSVQTFSPHHNPSHSHQEF